MEKIIKLWKREIFLSKKAIYTFGRYAASQLNRLVNRSGRGRSKILQNEQRSLTKAMRSMEERYRSEKLSASFDVRDDALLVDLNASGLEIGRMCAVLNELNTVHKDYAKSKRNDKAVEHGKLSKHMMHLLRLYMMGIDILERKEVITYRAKEHDLLMDIRAGKYLKDDLMTPTDEFNKLLADYKKRFDEAAERTTLPDGPDLSKINELSIKINKLLHI